MEEELIEGELILQDSDREKLDGIVEQMENNNESEEYIMSVVEDFKSKYQVKKKGESPGTGEEGNMESITEGEEEVGSLDSGETVLLPEFQQEQIPQIIDEITGEPINLYKGNPLNDTRAARESPQAYINASPEYQAYQERLKQYQKNIDERDQGKKLKQEKEQRQKELDAFTQEQISKLTPFQQSQIQAKQAQSDTPLTDEEIQDLIKDSTLGSIQKDIEDMRDVESKTEIQEAIDLEKDVKTEEERKKTLGENKELLEKIDNVSKGDLDWRGAKNTMRYIQDNFGDLGFQARETLLGNVVIYHKNAPPFELETTEEGIKEFKKFLKDYASFSESPFTERQLESEAYKFAKAELAKEGLNLDVAHDMYNEIFKNKRKLELLDGFLGTTETTYKPTGGRLGVAPVKDQEKFVRDPDASVLGIGFDEQDVEDFRDMFVINKKGEIVPASSKKLKEIQQEAKANYDKYQEAVGGQSLMAYNQDILEKFDKLMSVKSSEATALAAKSNEASVAELDAIQEVSREVFNKELQDIELEDLEGNPRRIEVYNDLLQQYGNAKYFAEEAGKLYSNAQTFWDVKMDKQVTSESEDNLKGFLQAWSKNSLRGEAGDLLLWQGLGLDVDNFPEERRERAEKIASIMKEYMDSPSSMMQLRRNRGEFFSIGHERLGSVGYEALRNPLEFITTLFGESISQMLPYGKKLIGTGFGLGSAYGLATGAPTFNPLAIAGSTLAGGIRGAGAGFVLANGAMEYTNALLEAAEEFGYNPLSPDDWEKALLDPRVWTKGRNVGLARGIPIMLADAIGLGIAGKIFGTTARAFNPSRLARMGMITAEVAAQPFFEALGEYAAQRSRMAFIGDRTHVDWNEVVYEAGGSLGGVFANPIQSSNLIYNYYQANNEKANQRLAQSLTNIKNVVTQSAKPEKILSWAQNMHKLGRIDQTTLSEIEANISARRDADEAITNANPQLLITGEKLTDLKKGKSVLQKADDFIRGNKVRNRVATLYKLRNALEVNPDAKMINKEKISAINNEIVELVNTGKLVEDEKAFKIDNTLSRLIQGQQFKINNKNVTPQEFVSIVENMSTEKYKEARSKMSFPPLDQLSEEVKSVLLNKNKELNKIEEAVIEDDIVDDIMDFEFVKASDLTNEQINALPEEEQKAYRSFIADSKSVYDTYIQNFNQLKEQKEQAQKEYAEIEKNSKKNIFSKIFNKKLRDAYYKQEDIDNQLEELTGKYEEDINERETQLKKQLKKLRNAIQKPSPKKVDVQQPSTDGPTVGVRDTKGNQVTPEAKKEEVKAKEKVEEEVVETEEEVEEETPATPEAQAEAKELEDELGLIDLEVEEKEKEKKKAQTVKKAKATRAFNKLKKSIDDATSYELTKSKPKSLKDGGVLTTYTLKDKEGLFQEGSLDYIEKTIDGKKQKAFILQGNKLGGKYRIKKSIINEILKGGIDGLEATRKMLENAAYFDLKEEYMAQDKLVIGLSKLIEFLASDVTRSEELISDNFDVEERKILTFLSKVLNVKNIPILKRLDVENESQFFTNVLSEEAQKSAKKSIRQDDFYGMLAGRTEREGNFKVRNILKQTISQGRKDMYIMWNEALSEPIYIKDGKKDYNVFLDIMAHELGHYFSYNTLAEKINTDEAFAKNFLKDYTKWYVENYGVSPLNKTQAKALKIPESKLIAPEAELLEEVLLSQASVSQVYDFLMGKTNLVSHRLASPSSLEREVTTYDTFDKYIGSISEYVAEEVKRWVTESKKPKNQIEKFFKDIADKLKKAYAYIKKMRPELSSTLREFMDEIFTPVDTVFSDMDMKLMDDRNMALLFKDVDINIVPTNDLSAAFEYDVEAKINIDKAAKKKGKQPLDKSRVLDITLDMTPEQLVEAGKQKLYSDESIKLLLKKYFPNLKAAQRNALVDQEIKYLLLDGGSYGLSIPLPPAFRNVLGGIVNGLTLFEGIKDALETYRSEKKRTPKEMIDFAIKTLRNHYVYKEQAGNKVLQEQLELAIVEIMKPADITPSLQTRIKAIKNNIKNLNLGKNQLKKAQAKIITLLRQQLDTKYITKKEFNKALTLIKSIEINNYDGVFNNLIELVDQVQLRKKAQTLLALRDKLKRLGSLKKSKGGRAISPRYVGAMGQLFFSEAAKILDMLLKRNSTKENERAKALRAEKKLMQDLFVTDDDGQILTYDIKDSVRKAIEKYEENEKLTIDEKNLVAKYSAYTYLNKLMKLPYDQMVKYIQGQELDAFGETLSDYESMARILLKSAVLSRSSKNRRLRSEMAQSQIKIFGDKLFEYKDGNVVYEFKRPTNEESYALITNEMIDEVVNKPLEEIAFKDENNNDFLLRYDPESKEIEIGRPRPLDTQELAKEWRTTAEQIERANTNQEDWRGRIKNVWNIIVDLEKVTDEFTWVKFATRLTATGVISNLKTYLVHYGDFAVKEIFDKLNFMGNKQLEYYYETQKFIDELANETFKVKDGLKSLMDNPRISENYDIEMKSGNTVRFKGSELMYAYAQSLNPESAQMLFGDRLLEDGTYKNNPPYDYYFNRNTFYDQMAKSLGTDNLQFIEDVVDFLSTIEYEKINDVYEKVNYVTLPKAEKFFPRLVITDKGKNSDPDSIQLGKDENFFNQFNAQFMSFLKTRVSKKGKIRVLGTDFFGILDNYLKDETRFRAFAEGTKDISAVFSEPSFNHALEMGYAKDMVAQMISTSINPNEMYNAMSQNTLINDFLTTYVLAVLSYKAIQIPKQGISFVMAFSDYNYDPNFKPKTFAGMVAKTFQDMAMFSADAVNIYANYKKNIKEAEDVSAQFKDRITEENIFTLVSGMKGTEVGKRLKIASRLGGKFTKWGDELGVMGYWINYKRDIANGMSKAKALEKFNEYNETQQSRRIQDLTRAQLNKSIYQRMMFSFMSVGILYLNQVIQSATKMAFRRGGKRDFSQKNVRQLIMNLGVGNAMFFLAGNFLRLFGSPEDKEKFWKEFATYLMGLYLFESSMVFFGIIAGGIKEMLVDKKNPYLTNTVNPLRSLYNSARALADSNIVVSDEKERRRYAKAFKDVMLITGINVAPFEGMYNVVNELTKTGDFDGRDMATIFGISKSALPEIWNEKDWLKWYDYETWDQIRRIQESLDPKLEYIQKKAANMKAKGQQIKYKKLNKGSLNDPKFERE